MLKEKKWYDNQAAQKKEKWSRNNNIILKGINIDKDINPSKQVEIIIKEI